MKRVLVKEVMEGVELVSQTRMCVVLDAMADRSVVQVEEDRMQAMMVLVGERASWRTNSSPRPRLAPVMQ